MAIDTTMVRSRRSLLTATLAGLAGAAAATLAGAQRVLGGAGDNGMPVLVGGTYDNAQSATVIVNNGNGGPAIRAGNNGTGTGVEAFSEHGKGVTGSSTDGEGIYGFAIAGTGVHGLSGDVANEAHNYAAAVLGEANLSAGVSVLGNNYATSGIAIGVQGTSLSPAGLASIGWASKGGTGVIGFAGPNFPSVPVRTGVYGAAPAGRGVIAAGGAAQLRLMPSSAATHPASGLAGDLFVDSSHHLWFCLGGTTWKQIV